MINVSPHNLSTHFTFAFIKFQATHKTFYISFLSFLLKSEILLAIYIRFGKHPREDT